MQQGLLGAATEPSLPSVRPNQTKIHQTQIAWSDVGFSVGEKRILTGCTGTCAAGSLTAIIGPSGAGKTTLLNILAGRLSPSSGSVAVDGRRIQAHSTDLARQMAYVTQEDALYPHCTPREALIFSAQLRLPSHVNGVEKRRKADEMLELLGLKSCADTLIGSEMRRGISGGEKKRTSIGVELVTDPGLLLLDEPTSGLDSFAAVTVVRTLQALAQSGCTVLCTIHQPSSEVFALFDRVLLLGGGTQMFSGPREEIVMHFSQLGIDCPPQHNTADTLLYIMQTAAPTTLEKIRVAAAEKVAVSPLSGEADGLRIQPGQRSRCMQLGALLVRELRGLWRNKPALYARFGMTGILNLLFAFIFKGAGMWPTQGADLSEEARFLLINDSISNHFGAITQILIGTMFGAAQPMMLEFPLERPIFIREYRTAHYGAAVYFASKLLVELPLVFVQSTVVFLVSYWLMELQGDLFFLILIAWAMSVVAASVALMLGCLLPNVKVAVQLSPAVFVPQLLFAGFFIRVADIPAFLRWCQYLCSLKFAINLAMIVEFGRPCDVEVLVHQHRLNETLAKSINVACENLLTRNDVSDDKWWLYASILAAIFVAFRLLSLVALKAKAAG